MRWERVVYKDKTKEYYHVCFNHKNQDTVDLRALTNAEKKFMETTGMYNEFGLFLSSTFFYPLVGQSLVVKTVVIYSMNPPRSLISDKLYATKVSDISFSQSPWQRFDGYHQDGDVFVTQKIVDHQSFSGPEYATDPMEQNMARIADGSPHTLNWEMFQSLFNFRRTGSLAGILYGKFGPFYTDSKS